jgi:hypothetical protein
MTNPRDLIKRLADCLHEAAGDVEGWGNYASSYFQEKHDLSGNVAKIHAQADEARAYLSQPEPEGPTDEELRQLWLELYAFHDGPTSGDVVEIARAVLARWGRPSIEPVPVSERLPKAEDCDAQGNCWLTNDSTEPGWVLDNSEKCTNWTHWLPHWALPVPTQHGCTRLP